jgi:hypothetical protein
MLDEKVPTQSEEITGGNRGSEMDPGLQSNPDSDKCKGNPHPKVVTPPG